MIFLLVPDQHVKGDYQFPVEFSASVHSLISAVYGGINMKNDALLCLE